MRRAITEPEVRVVLAKDADEATLSEGHWRLYWLSAPRPTVLRPYMNADGEVFPLIPPDFDNLRRLMNELGAAYEFHPHARGSAELRASGTAAVYLFEWLMGLIAPS